MNRSLLKNYSGCLLLATLVLGAVGCNKSPLAEPEIIPIALRDVQADRLSYKYEADVTAPSIDQFSAGSKYERSEAIQSDFDENRPLEILDRTIASPSGDRVLAVFRKGDDVISDYRLDMYTKNGKLLRKITHAEMAVQFPDTIVWSPDGNNVAFVAKVRGASETLNDPAAAREEKPEVVDTDEEKGEDSSENDGGKTPEATPQSVEAASDVITFRTEQIYTCNADGGDVKPLTKVEGLMYFYFVWAPDSSALAALAAIRTEWQFFETRAKEAGQLFVPRGRPRIIEKNGRERRLDDMATAVQPVWSPDSAKIAIAYDKQVRIYDGVRNQPSQAAIPLKNDLLISSRSYEQKLRLEGESNSNTTAGQSSTDSGARTNRTCCSRPSSGCMRTNQVSADVSNANWPGATTGTSFERRPVKRLLS